jgi:hypothetical protein
MIVAAAVAVIIIVIVIYFAVIVVKYSPGLLEQRDIPPSRLTSVHVPL